MITKTNQTSKYMNEAVRDALHLIRIGESAILYSSIDVKSLENLFGKDNLMVIHLTSAEAMNKFDYNGQLWFVSYSEAILKVMAYADAKLYILHDMGVKLSKREKSEFLHLTSKSEVERKFWKIYDRYCEDFED